MLKLSIAIRGPGDEPYPLNPQIGDKQERQVLMPTQIKRKFYQLSLAFLEGHNIPTQDGFFRDNVESKIYIYSTY